MLGLPRLTKLTRAPKSDDRQAIIIGLLPAALVATVFIVIPILFSFYLSFWDWPLVGPARRFTGLENWRRLWGDHEFWAALRVTALYTLGSVPANAALSLGLALVLNRPLRGQTLYRLAFFAPVVLSSVVAALFWEGALQPQIGFVNRALRAMGLPGPGWLADPAWALPALILIHLWRFTGYHALIFLAGLQSIPHEYYEAAVIDGAGSWARFRHVTWPLLKPTTALVLITAAIFTFQVFGPVYVLTGGGPARSTTTIVFYLYERAIGLRQLGYGATLGWALFLVLFPLTWWQFQRWAKG
jgi:multiple sugar transport system permease protein